MTTTDPITRPIHERWSLMEHGGHTFQVLDGEPVIALRPQEVDPAEALIRLAGKTHAVLVNLPDGAGGGQIVTWSYPSGTVEAAWRPNPAATWTPVDMLGGSVVVAP